MGYKVKEIFYTLQGEGANSGRPAVFCRFAGCNLWDGREQSRGTAICKFCDTDFVGTNGINGGKFESAEELAERIAGEWPTRLDSPSRRNRFVVCTGGEPLLQLDAMLVESLHARSFLVAVETNGTVSPPDGIDWICVSPKAGAGLLVECGDELKLIFPQDNIDPEIYGNLRFRHFFLQPMDGPDRMQNTNLAIDYCMSHPQWRLSLQTHKIVGIR